MITAIKWLLLQHVMPTVIPLRGQQLLVIVQRFPQHVIVLLAQLEDAACTLQRLRHCLQRWRRRGLSQGTRVAMARQQDPASSNNTTTICVHEQT